MFLILKNRKMKKHLKNTLSSMKKAAGIKRVKKYYLGYSNYSFDLWIILHKSNTK